MHAVFIASPVENSAESPTGTRSMLLMITRSIGTAKAAANDSRRAHATEGFCNSAADAGVRYIAKAVVCTVIASTLTAEPGCAVPDAEGEFDLDLDAVMVAVDVGIEEGSDDVVAVAILVEYGDTD